MIGVGSWGGNDWTYGGAYTGGVSPLAWDGGEGEGRQWEVKGDWRMGEMALCDVEGEVD
jgi:hypothetical protein